MTVSYQYDVASSSTGGFFRLLWRWRGSIWKLLYKELLLFIAIYFFIALSYDFLMNDHYKRLYEQIVIFCSSFVEIIPLSFILGFYVSFTATRWWQQYTAIPWPDKLMNIIALYVPGNDVTSRVLRRTLMRYLNLTLVLVLRSISIPVKRRFPTKEHLVEAGFMSRPELEMYSSVPSHEFNTFWIPCTWFVNLLREAKSECRITDSGGIKLIMEEFNEFRSKCGLLWSYDWVSIPLVYTQVVTLSTQAFFLASLLGRQHINPPKDGDIKSHPYGEYYIPVFTVLQFILYMGLLKLGEQLINPFGDDDEDFELNWIIDRHLKVSFLGVDILNSDPPPLIKDNYFDEMDIKLPYTEAAVAHKVKTYRGSVAAFHVPTDKHALVIPEFEDDNGENTDDEPSTIQSNRDATVRTSSWSLFGRKRKLSSSIDSFNSETMVENGLMEETEMPTIPPNRSWPNFLESQGLTLKTLSPQPPNPSVWPNRLTDEKAIEDTQGIRGSATSSRPLGGGDATTAGKPPIAPTTILGARPRFENELAKQSSFSSSQSSIAIPLGEDSDRRSSTNSTSKFFGFRKFPLQVFSKEFANAPISIFNDMFDPTGKPITDRTSISSISTKSEKIGSSTSKPAKSLIKSHRSIDPKLRIRPFRSKVTFSEDTKAGDNSVHTARLEPNRFCYSKWDSSSDSVSSAFKPEEQLSLKQPPPPRIFSSSSNLGLTKPPSDPSFSESTKRRQSYDPSLYLEKCEEMNKDNWLHYQSLPNIQEEDQLTSPTDTRPSSPEHPTTIITPITLVSQPSITSNGNEGIPMTPTNSGLLSPQMSLDQANFGSTRRRSIKRQRSQDITDDDLKLQSLPPPPCLPKVVATPVIKQSSDESQTSSLTDNSTSSGRIMPPSILRRRKEDLKPRQASTESDTGSYHTVHSFRMQIEKSNSSSIDSFTSAISESNQAGGSNSNGNSSSVTVPVNVSEDQISLAENRLLTFTKIESCLVPKIIFSQSTPSVTSQSSDDQNSPKWDEHYPEYSSAETVTDISYQLHHDFESEANVSHPCTASPSPSVSGTSSTTSLNQMTGQASTTATPLNNHVKRKH